MNAAHGAHHVSPPALARWSRSCRLESDPDPCSLTPVRFGAVALGENTGFLGCARCALSQAVRALTAGGLRARAFELRREPVIAGRAFAEAGGDLDRLIRRCSVCDPVELLPNTAEFRTVGPLNGL